MVLTEILLQKILIKLWLFFYVQRVPGRTHVGTLVICGATNWDIIGRRAPPKGTKAPTGRNLYIPHTLEPLSQTRVRYVVSGPNSAHTVIITEEGKAMTFGKIKFPLNVFICKQAVTSNFYNSYFQVETKKVNWVLKIAQEKTSQLWSKVYKNIPSLMRLQGEITLCS